MPGGQGAAFKLFEDDKVTGFYLENRSEKVLLVISRNRHSPSQPPSSTSQYFQSKPGGAEHDEGEKHNRAEPPPSLTPIFCCEHVFLLVFPCREMGDRVARDTFSPNTATTEGSGQECSLKLTPEAETSTTREPKAVSRSLLHVSSLSFPLFL